MRLWSGLICLAMLACDGDGKSDADRDDVDDTDVVGDDDDDDGDDHAGLWTVSEVTTIDGSSLDELVGTLLIDIDGDDVDLDFHVAVLEDGLMVSLDTEALSGIIDGDRWVLDIEDDKQQVFAVSEQDDQLILTWDGEDDRDDVDGSNDEGPAELVLVPYEPGPGVVIGEWVGVYLEQGGESADLGVCVEDGGGSAEHVIEVELSDRGGFELRRTSDFYDDDECEHYDETEVERMEGMARELDGQVEVWLWDAAEEDNSEWLLYDVDMVDGELTLEAVDCEPTSRCSEELGMVVVLQAD